MFFFQKNQQLSDIRRHAVVTQYIAGVTYAGKKDTRVSLLPTLKDDSCSFQYLTRALIHTFPKGISVM